MAVRFIRFPKKEIQTKLIRNQEHREFRERWLQRLTSWPKGTKEREVRERFIQAQISWLAWLDENDRLLTRSLARLNGNAQVTPEAE